MTCKDPRAQSLLAYIADIQAEAEATATYGDHWRISDYMARKSGKAGEICNLYSDIDRLTAKAAHRPGSIGARKARQAIKQAHRKIKERQIDIELPFSEYKPTRPKYYTAPPAQHYERGGGRRVRSADVCGTGGDPGQQAQA